jgi:hypothetical protein
MAAMSEIHKYLIYRKRGHTRNVRLKDHIMVVIAERYKPPYPPGIGLGMRNVDRWHRDSVLELNSEKSLTNILRAAMRSVSNA